MLWIHLHVNINCYWIQTFIFPRSQAGNNRSQEKAIENPLDEIPSNEWNDQWTKGFDGAVCTFFIVIRNRDSESGQCRCFSSGNDHYPRRCCNSSLALIADYSVTAAHHICTTKIIHISILSCNNPDRLAHSIHSQFKTCNNLHNKQLCQNNNACVP